MADSVIIPNPDREPWQALPFPNGAARNLTQLTLSLSGSQVSNLELLSKLTGLQSLSIESATRAQRMSLRNIPASLVELKF